MVAEIIIFYGFQAVFGRTFDSFPSFTAMGICRWEWFDFRLPFKQKEWQEQEQEHEQQQQQETARRKKELKSPFSMGFRSYIREFFGAILMLFRPSLPWGFAAGSGSILGCLLDRSSRSSSSRRKQRLQQQAKNDC